MRLPCCCVVWGVLAAGWAGPAAAEPTTTPVPTNLVFGEGLSLNPVRFREPREGDVYLPVNINNWWGYAAQDGDLIVFTAYEWTDYEFDGMLRAVQDGKTGFLKKSGNWYIEPTFHYADRFAEGHAIVADEKGRITFINKAGKPITRQFFAGALRFKDGVAAVLIDGKVGFINKAGDMEIRPQFTQARSFHDGVAAVRLPAEKGFDRVGYINRVGDLVFADKTGKVAELGDFNDSLARVRVRLGDGKQAWGYIDRKFKLRIDPRFADARDFVDGRAAVKIGQKWGYIDKTGQLVIQPIFDDADDFDDTFAMVRVGELWGYSDKIGKGGITPQFAFAEPYFLGVARVQAEPNFGYIDVAGRPIWNPRCVFDKGIVDTRPTTRAAASAVDEIVGDLEAPRPPARRSKRPDYPPEYRYDEVLPQPQPRP